MNANGAGSATELRVLLISPVRGVDPLSGDVTYTEQLLSSPPPGVRYTTYTDAIAAGSLIEHGSRQAVQASPRSHLAKELGLAACRKLESWVRRTGLVYREPIRVFEVMPGAFDVVHVHVFHTRFLGTHPSVVVSAGGPLQWVYSNAWGWSQGRIALAEAFDRVAGALWDATMTGVRRGRADRFVTLSNDFKTWLIQRGWPADLIDVAPNYLDFPAMPPRAPRKPTCLGFIAKDFDAKGGPLVLEAFEMLRLRHPELELLVVGSTPRLAEEERESQGIRWLPLVDRSALISEILPTIDVFVYPSHCDTSVPYGPQEALASGIPCVVPDYRALPELIGRGAGRVSRPGDAASVVAAVEELLEPLTWKSASDAALTRFQEHFSAASQSPALGSVYRTVFRPNGKDDALMPPHGQMTASVVIATYNRSDHVRVCLEHLASQTLQPREIVVVDASPDSRTAEVVARFPGVVYLRNDLGRGHTATSRAIGMASVTADIVAFIDDDAYAEPEWLEELVLRYVDGVGAVGGRARNGLPGEESEGIHEIGMLLPDGRLTGNFAADPGRDVDVDHLLGANMSVRRDVVEALGGIHDHYPGTCLREETDIALRMGQAGYRLVYTPAAVVRHVGGTYAKGHRFDTRYKYFGARNHMVLLAHNLGFRDPRSLGNLRVVSVSVLHDLRAAARAPFDPERTSASAKARGVASGVVAAAAHTAGTLVGLAASARLALSPRPRASVAPTVSTPGP